MEDTEVGAVMATAGAEVGEATVGAAMAIVPGAGAVGVGAAAGVSDSALVGDGEAGAGAVGMAPAIGVGLTMVGI